MQSRVAFSSDSDSRLGSMDGVSVLDLVLGWIILSSCFRLPFVFLGKGIAAWVLVPLSVFSSWWGGHSYIFDEFRGCGARTFGIKELGQFIFGIFHLDNSTNLLCWENNRCQWDIPEDIWRSAFTIQNFIFILIKTWRNFLFEMAWHSLSHRWPTDIKDVFVMLQKHKFLMQYVEVLRVIGILVVCPLNCCQEV